MSLERSDSGDFVRNYRKLWVCLQSYRIGTNAQLLQVVPFNL